ncbi:hypothetical protein [Kamptonema formosum]|uniref:hypothetical protein n=1 Tax=Kamptonema formosum TaxID=331992 RepID=UPI0012DD36F1|nr:hypothetical protein [Oscillatoria sp. PCC 10802]
MFAQSPRCRLPLPVSAVKLGPRVRFRHALPLRQRECQNGESRPNEQQAAPNRTAQNAIFALGEVKSAIRFCHRCRQHAAGTATAPTHPTHEGPNLRLGVGGWQQQVIYTLLKTVTQT